MELVIGVVIGAVVGIVFYRYMLRKNPEKLQQWVNEVKAKAADLRS